MAAVLKHNTQPEPLAAHEAAPVVIVGAGPVGIRAAQELHRRLPDQPVVLYGEEPSEPYNRMRLSSFLGGELDWQALTRDLKLPQSANLDARFGCAVMSIDREACEVRDASGVIQSYLRLILATGSRPHVPDIPGIRLPGVYTFRDISDAHKLLARRVRSRRTLVLGGGLLGLEAARAMRRFNTEVCVIEHYSRLMMRQLDDGAAQYLIEHMKTLGIEVVLGDSVRRVLGGAAVTGVQLRSERILHCDTVLVATGIRPNIELARAAGLFVGQGIRVNDRMLTSDPRIYAIGECAEHRNRVYGLVAPGLEQAAVAAHDIAGGKANYNGSLVATRLKVLDLPVFSIGSATEEELPDFGRERCYRKGNIYRKLVTCRGRLIGAIAVGECKELNRLQEAVLRRCRIWPWQLWRFYRHGTLWPARELASVVQWPEATTVCNCTGVTRGQLGEALASGCSAVEELAARTGASTVCGACRPLLAELAGGNVALAPARGYRPLFGIAALAMVFTLLMLLAPSIPYATSVDVPWQWDVLWRDGLWKQVSGFTVLGMTLLGSLMSLRKRWARLSFGGFAWWRLAHVLLGVGALLALLAHTGGRLGSQLNLLLMSSFLGLTVVGGIAGGVIASEHRIGGMLARRLRDNWVWLHILLAWPLPLLLAFHVAKTYYF
ncbi:MAG: FAD-dependent oxidoreductase [Burkholderiales bacterium]|nr:FAD-dependent oxidoreductase [Burkholderiales bacterium]MBY0576263.1 FAD-dependent oxidoreductase [Gallionellaceae bacterium]